MDLLDPELGLLNGEGLLTRLPVQIKYPMYLIPTLVTLVVVSLLTRQHNDRAVAEFYCRLDTPVGEEHKIKEAGFEVDQLEHLDHHDPEIKPKHQRTSSPQRLLLPDLLRLPGLLKTGDARLSDYIWDLAGTGVSILFVISFLFAINSLGNLF